MSLRPEILRALFDPMLQQKRDAIDGLRRLCAQRAHRSPDSQRPHMRNRACPVNINAEL